MAGLARIKLERGEADQALALTDSCLAATHPATAWTQISLAGLMVELGRAEEADPLANQGLTTLQDRLPAGHPRVAAAQAITVGAQP